MAKFYVPDTVPLNYNYALINNNYIDFYNKNTFYNESATFYRVWYNISPDTVEVKNRSFGGYNQTVLDTTNFDLTYDYWYRKDMPNILTSALVLSVFFIFTLNVITSIIRKGGILGGLL